MSFVSSEGTCDECGHDAQAHDLNTGPNGQPCTVCDTCEDYTCHMDSMISAADNARKEYEQFRAEERRL